MLGTQGHPGKPKPSAAAAWTGRRMAPYREGGGKHGRGAPRDGQIVATLRLAGRWRALGSWLAAAMLAVAMLSAACGGGGDEPAPTDAGQTAQTAQMAEPEPALVSADPPELELAGPPVDAAPAERESAQRLLLQADSLEHDGFWEAAADTRGRVVEGELGEALPGSELQSAQLAQARLLLRLGRTGEALVWIESVDRAGFEESNARALDLLEARATAALGEESAAVNALSRYLAADGPAAGTVLLMRAELLVGANRVDEGEADLRAVIDHRFALEDQVADARIALGSLLELQARYDEAQQQYFALLDDSPAYEAAALHRLGSIDWARGDAVSAEQWWLRLMQDYPWHWRATDALFQLDVGGLAVNPVVRGVVLYRQARYDEASETLTFFLEAEPAAAERHVAIYYLAAIAEDLGRPREAIVQYLSAVATDANGELADNALWWAARLSEELEELPLAALLYRRLADDYPSSPFAADARFLSGLISFLEGDIITAQATFAALLDENETADVQRGLIWHGKSLALLGDPGAATAYQEAAALDPFSYYGLRAEALLADQPRAPAVALSQPGLPGFLRGDDTVTWLIATAGADSPERRAAVLGSVDWRAAFELHAAGLRIEADAHFRELVQSYRAEPWILYLLALQFDALGLPHLRMTAAEAMLATFTEADLPGAPPELLAWVYPTDWQALATREATRSEFDDLLLYALIRQESRFNPDAGSPVGALGLTQVIGPTGAWIAEQVGDDEFDTGDLFRPHVALGYGAFYLGVQLDAFEGSAPLSLAAYNAGPGNAARWSDNDAGIDPDLFFERVSFAETNLYLRTVLQNYAWYRFIYAGASSPTLTERAAPVGAVAP